MQECQWCQWRSARAPPIHTLRPHSNRGWTSDCSELSAPQWELGVQSCWIGESSQGSSFGAARAPPPNTHLAPPTGVVIRCSLLTGLQLDHCPATVSDSLPFAWELGAVMTVMVTVAVTRYLLVLCSIL